MTDQNPKFDVKEEKFDEKEREKSEEKSTEKYRRDPIGAIVWAGILIWAGVVLLLSNLGYLENFKGYLPIEGTQFLWGSLGAWGLIFLGAGVILLLEVLIRLIVPSYRRSVTGTIILAFVFIGIGLGTLVAWNLIWPLVLIAIGVAIVIGVIFRRRG